MHGAGICGRGVVVKIHGGHGEVESCPRRLWRRRRDDKRSRWPWSIRDDVACSSNRGIHGVGRRDSERARLPRGDIERAGSVRQRDGVAVRIHEKWVFCAGENYVSGITGKRIAILV